MLSSIEKILLARAHGVGAWLDEAINTLATCNPMPKLEDLATLGWETVARILWIRDNFPLNKPPCRFKLDAIKCMHCSSSSSLMNYDLVFGCEHINSGDVELTFSGSASPTRISGTIDILVTLNEMQCLICKAPLYSNAVTCNSCSNTYRFSSMSTVRVTLYKVKTMIEEMFGEEIKELLDSF